MKSKQKFGYFRTTILICLLFFNYQVEGDDWNATSNVKEYRNSRREPILTRAPPVTKLGDPTISLTIPARKVCYKGSFDTKYNSCTYIDKDDEAIPIYKPCIGNSTLVDGYCIGTMISDYEKYCHG
ncbi:uncharacterized protein cubi_02611 [Cryptosporidium ubiquitum]|uniref:Oocyst wall protein n=1 Tax=Cryptosporidium ubiquitum TaxID=857276 RepID=A0A1J4MHB2_9CRYT|nr:uncharacterized protein cubi_02611 [Cryptosporidium ubiquitum]OII73399.1 hypothetical protein cubi_02611 [Cryptosporidium ubiquitum]